MNKLKNDIIFLDPKTLEQKCTYNGCYNKFKQKQKNYIYTDDYGYKFQSKGYYHQCNECEYTYSTELDKTKTKNARFHARLIHEDNTD